jgi:HEAT repeat protein
MIIRDPAILRGVGAGCGAGQMRYIKVKWLLTSPNVPVLLYSELNGELWEVRKVEVYADGRMDFASREEQSGSTRLGIEPLPTVEEIAAHREFEPAIVSAEEFESVWEKAKAGESA